MSDYTAYMVTDMLRDVVSSKYGASGTTAAIPGLDVAGKTGTTNYSSEDFTKYNLPASAVPDSWFAGYTSKYSIAVWSGYADQKTPITTSAERVLPQVLFKSVMSQISANTTTPNFKQPSSVVEVDGELYVKGTQPASTVKNKPVKNTLLAPTGLKAVYDETTQAINLSWTHDAATDQSVNYRVSVSVDGGGTQVLTETTEKTFTYGNPEDGKTYLFSVVAISGQDTSDAATTSIQIQAATPNQNVTVPDNTVDPTAPTDTVTPTDPNNSTNPTDPNTDQTNPTGGTNGIKPGEGGTDTSTNSNTSSNNKAKSNGVNSSPPSNSTSDNSQ